MDGAMVDGRMRAPWMEKWKYGALEFDGVFSLLHKPYLIILYLLVLWALKKA
jgi:hypothetical protein